MSRIYLAVYIRCIKLSDEIIHLTSDSNFKEEVVLCMAFKEK